MLYVRTRKKITPFVLTTSISDHYLIGCTRFLNYSPDATTCFYGRSYRNYSFEAASEFYSTIDRSYIYQLNDVDTVWSILKGHILKCANHLCPKRKITTKLNQPEWINTHILEPIADRDNKFTEAYDTKNPAILAEAKVLRTQARRAVRITRAEFITSQLRLSSDNPRKFWMQIKNLLSRKSTGTNITLHDKKDNPISLEDSPNHINNFFSTIGPNLAKQFEHTSTDLTPPETQSSCLSNHDSFGSDSASSDSTESQFCLHPIGEAELYKEIKAISIYKSSGITDLSSRILKDAMLAMIEDFGFLLNLSLSTCVVPAELKEAVVIPIPKIKHSHNVSDLRPISLLPLPGKVLEHFVHSNLLIHLDRHDLLSRWQFGFRPGLSTTDAIATLVDDVGLNLNNRQLTIATFIDFRKAFDTLDHTLILDRINQLNPSSVTLPWFESYLHNRSQSTLLNNIKSDKKPIITGVPQGSILGPLLFILHVNTLPSIPLHSKAIMYADDTVLYMPVESKSNQLSTANFQSDLDRLANWCHENKLSINTSKTQTMILGTNRRTRTNLLNLSLTMNGNALSLTQSYKYLGVLLNPSLTLDVHSQNIIGHVSGKIKTLSHLRTFIT